jgi:hypothetical protein
MGSEVGALRLTDCVSACKLLHRQVWKETETLEAWSRPYRRFKLLMYLVIVIDDLPKDTHLREQPCLLG